MSLIKLIRVSLFIIIFFTLEVFAVTRCDLCDSDGDLVSPNQSICSSCDKKMLEEYYNLMADLALKADSEWSEIPDADVSGLRAYFEKFRDTYVCKYENKSVRFFRHPCFCEERRQFINDLNQEYAQGLMADYDDKDLKQCDCGPSFLKPLGLTRYAVFRLREKNPNFLMELTGDSIAETVNVGISADIRPLVSDRGIAYIYRFLRTTGLLSVNGNERNERLNELEFSSILAIAYANLITGFRRGIDGRYIEEGNDDYGMQAAVLLVFLEQLGRWGYEDDKQKIFGNWVYKSTMELLLQNYEQDYACEVFRKESLKEEYLRNKCKKMADSIPLNLDAQDKESPFCDTYTGLRLSDFENAGLIKRRECLDESDKPNTGGRPALFTYRYDEGHNERVIWIEQEGLSIIVLVGAQLAVRVATDKVEGFLTERLHPLLERLYNKVNEISSGSSPRFSWFPELRPPMIWFETIE